MDKHTLLNTEMFKDNEYLERYINLINSNLSTESKPFITQQHHIVPVHVFKYKKMPIDNSINNLVNLKFSDHLLAHYYLMRCANNTRVELANANAIFKNINNPHSQDLETWIINNSDLLNDINKRRCELISIHHSDVSGVKNSRATKVYQYDKNGKIVCVYSLINDCAQALHYSPDSLRSILSRNKIIQINEFFYSKNSNINLVEIKQYSLYKQQLIKRKRSPRMFICEYCGKEYSLLLSEQNYISSLEHHHYCYECAKKHCGKAKRR